MYSSEIKISYEDVKKRIAAAAARSGRHATDIQLVAVSKLQPLEKIQSLIDFGQGHFGENYVQEWMEKSDLLSEKHTVHWHLIGPLQRNKVKLIVGNCDLIHSVDRWEIAQEISKIALAKKITQPLLVQIKIGGEESKHGVLPEEANTLLSRISRLPGVLLRGMMTLPPLETNEHSSRRSLKEAKALFDRWNKEFKDFDTLSMGTSHDFEWAIEEGSNMVRVGTILFGSRPV
ncbi:MAG: YggS family pyridoxal phosphate-dependent enzyme [Bdellovibrionales bacterium]|nr:YggS family pyridoxal phosphate-dependent enzyme [Bdellovibrionales bacterium]